MRLEGFEGNNVFVEIESAAFEAGELMADDIVEIAKLKCPAKTGALRNSIRKTMINERPGNFRVYAGNRNAYYARFVEYGTARKPGGSPFLRPAFQTAANINKIETAIQRALGEMAA